MRNLLFAVVDAILSADAEDAWRYGTIADHFFAEERLGAWRSLWGVL